MRNLWIQRGFLTLCLVLAFLFWHTPLLLPIRLLVVFFHEISHGLVAVATGGQVVSIEFGLKEWGLCKTVGGSPLLVLSAGYVGSMVVGAVLLWFSIRTKKDRALSIALGLVLCLIAVFWVKGAGIIIALFSGAVFIFVGVFLNGAVADFFLKFVAISSCLYVLMDIRYDLFGEHTKLPGYHSDAHAMSEFTGIPASVWAGIWLLTAVAVLWLMLRYAYKKGR